MNSPAHDPVIAVSSFGPLMLAGLPAAIWFGIATFICLGVTALLGYLVMKGRYNVPFAWHLRMAAFTVCLAVIHIVLVMMILF